MRDHGHLSSPNTERDAPAPHPRSKTGRCEEPKSENLRILNAAGVIVEEIDGPSDCYVQARKALAPLAGLIAELAAPQARNCCLPVAALVG